ncbi:MAG: PilZ domain-containing protein [Deltaproteobacteria bacterium]
MNAAEPGVLQIEILEDTGLLSRAGTATLTNAVLRFQPTRLEALVGVKLWSMDLREVSQLELAANGKTLSVHAASGTRRLRGRACQELHDRLAEAIARRDAIEHDPVLLEGPGELSVGGQPGRAGSLRVTRGRIHFDGDGGALVRTCEEIKRFGIDSTRRALEMQFESGSWHVTGPLAFPMLTLLAGLREGTRSGARVEVWQGRLARGPLEIAGQIVVTAERFRFTPTGLVDALAGTAEDIDEPIAALDRLAISGRLEPRLDIGWATRERRFRVPDPAHSFAVLCSAMISTPGAGEPALTHAGIVADAAALSRWTTDTAQALLAAPVVVTTSATAAERGWLVVTTHLVQVIAPSAVWKFTYEEIQDPEKQGVGTITLHSREHVLTVVPRAGAATAAAFWAARPVRARKSFENSMPRIRVDPDAKGRNRRESFRVPAQTSVQGRLACVGNEKGFEVTLRDLSPGGCAATLDRPIEADSRWLLRIDMVVPGSVVVQALARHVKTERVYKLESGVDSAPAWRVGFVFFGLTPEVTQRLQEMWMALQRVNVKIERK